MVYSKSVEHIALAEARTVIEAILQEALKDPDSPIAVAVTNADGELVSFASMDGAASGPRGYAIRKAYTSAVMGQASGAFAAVLKARGGDVSIFGDPNLITFPGGKPLKSDGIVVGAMGVSGRESSEDERLADIGAAAIGFATE